MPPDITPKATTSRKRPAQSKRGAIACVRCKERKAKCVPAPPGTSNVPTCENCHLARATCVYLDRTPNELFLLEYVSQLEQRVAILELELAQYQPNSIHVVDHSSTQAAAIESLTQQYQHSAWPSAEAGPSQQQGSQGSSRPGPLSVSHEPALMEKKGAKGEGENDDLAYGLELLTLSGTGEPVYVGASSGVNWARVCATALRGPRSSEDGPALSRFNYLAPPETSSIDDAVSYSQHHPVPPLPPAPLATRYLEAAYQHIQARYSFLDWPTVRNWHEHREEIVNRPMWGAGRGTDFRRSMAAFTLWLLYGYGARLTEDEQLEGAVNHEVYHNIAVACLSNVANHTSIATVQAELLLTIYSLRHPQPEISVWQTAGLALRTAVQVGLHRKARSVAERERNPLAYEIKKRTFWTLYTIDRMLALQLGRPSGIQDRDIDVEMPLNIDADFTDAKVIFAMQTRQIEATRGQSQGDEFAKGYETVTSMTSSIHNTRLNRLKQLVQDAIYRLDHPLEDRSDLIPSNQNITEVDDLLARLHAWKDSSPTLPPGRSGVPLLSRGQQDMEYHNCVQMLLRPVISSGLGLDRYLPKCFDSAAALCEGQWSLLNDSATYRLSNWALYRLFLSGLTLLHLATSSPTSFRVDLSRAQSALHRCKESLKIYVRHLPAMKGYGDVFTDLVTAWETKYRSGRLGAGDQILRNTSRAQQRHTGVTVKNERSSSQDPTSYRYSSRLSHSPPTVSDPLAWLDMSGNSVQNPYQTGPPLRNTQYSGHHQMFQSSSADNASNQYSLYAQSIPQQPTLGQSSTMMPSSHTYGASQQQGQYSMINEGAGNVGNIPQLEQLSAAPGGSVRDDFFSLLASLGVNMDETLGGSMPPIAEDHLWTSDWGMYGAGTHGMAYTGNGDSERDAGGHIGQGAVPEATQRISSESLLSGWQDQHDLAGISIDGQDAVWTFPFM